nr:ABC transporter ATP-binding protein [Corynebacterium mendelii]
MGLIPQVNVRALHHVSLSAHTGEAIGVLGLNGSGKSTLMRAMAGLEAPETGEILASSQPMLLGVSAALEPSLSGLQNIRLGCLAIGIHPDQLDEAVAEIVDFIDIGDSIYLPMATYSSGMSGRLRFAIATAARSDILLIDEAMSTGDAAFVKRSEVKMKTMRENAGTMFLVSHAAQTIEKMCTRAVWLHHGVMIGDGPARELAREYRQWAWHLAQDKPEEAAEMMRERLSELPEDTRGYLEKIENRNNS